MKRQLAISRRSMLIALASLLSCCSGLQADEPANQEKPRMLMVTQSAGFRHQPVNRGDQLMSPAEKAMQKLAYRTKLFEVDFTQDVATHLTRENLQKYDIVAFYTSGNLPVASQDLKYLLDEWVRQPGHGFLGFHSASDTYKKHEPYWDFIGGSFNGHPWHQNAKVTITVHDTEHPTMKPFGKEIELTDEIYQYVNWQPEKVRVLMSLDMAKTGIKRPYHVPVAWVKQVGEGRMYYNNLGHRPETWENEKFLQSIEGAIRWFQGTEDGKAQPNPDVSREQHQLSIDAAKEAGITQNSLEEKRREDEARKKAQALKKKAAKSDK
jgi:type 1 glutamine amidotransferase